MFVRSTMFTMPLLCTIVLVQTIQTCEISTCVFNKEYNGKSKVIKIKPPKQESWVPSDRLDRIDKTIFGEVLLPYNYKNIVNASQKKLVYVKNEAYQKLIVTAQEQLHNKKEAIEAAYKNEKSSSRLDGTKCIRLSEAIDRLEKYEEILKKNDRFSHLCHGIILTTQTKRCIALWAFLNQKQN